MTLVDSIVIVQLVTFMALAVLFWRAGQHTLAIAQMCYAVATFVLFFGKT